MKKTILSTLVIGTLGLSTAFAIPQVKMGAFNAGSSGNYRADPNADLAYVIGNYANGKSTDGTWFGTFCLEQNEFFTPGHIYDVTLNNGAVGGGNGGNIVGGKDIISIGTAYLYQQFALGTLSGFTYGSSTSALQLQNAIWSLEGETPVGNTGTFLALAMTVTNYDQNYTGSAVKVMNLSKTDSAGVTTKFQDQLVYLGVPDGGMTLALLGLGLAGLATIKRRFRI